MNRTLRWLTWAGTITLLAFYAHVGMLAAQPQVSHLYRLFYVDKGLRDWNHGKGPVYALGQQLDFREAQPYQSRVGWAYPEEWGTWTDGPVAELHFRVQGLPRSVSMDVNPFVAPQAGLPAQTLRIFANGMAVGEYSLQSAQVLRVELPASAMAFFNAGAGLRMFGTLTRWVKPTNRRRRRWRRPARTRWWSTRWAGRMHVRWDETAQATPHGQIVFFAEFLATAGVFDRWVQDCPLRYSSPNASRVRDVLGTLMLGILAGSKRYAHIAGVRGDAVAAKALGLRGMVSEDSVRRASRRRWCQRPASRGCARLADGQRARGPGSAVGAGHGRHHQAAVRPPGRRRDWLQPAQAGPAQPRAAHLLGGQPAPGARRRAQFGQAAHLGSRQGRDGAAARRARRQGPALVRGDCGYGNEDIIDVCEQRDLRYLLRLRKTANVKRLIERLFRREDWTRATEASQGWQAIEDELRLSGWSKAAPRGGAAPAHQARHRAHDASKKRGQHEANNNSCWRCRTTRCRTTRRSGSTPCWRPTRPTTSRRSASSTATAATARTALTS
jgi:hypothetical protein